MSTNYFKQLIPSKKSLSYLLGLPLWVVFCFALAQVLVWLIIMSLDQLGVPMKNIEETVFQLTVSVMVYVLTIVLTIGAPYWVRKIRTTRQDLGIDKLPAWLDIGLAPLAFVIYAIISAAALIAIGYFVPSFNLDQAQDVGFENLKQKIDMVLAFATLVVIAPIAEELLFRGYLYGKLRKHASMVLAIVATSVLFGVVHGQWNVGIDTFILGAVLCGLREITGTIWAGVLVHMIKNGVAFFVLFIYPNMGL